MLRFLVQTKRKYKKKTQPSRNEEDDEDRKQTTEAQMKELQKVSVQTQIATKTATFPSWMTPMKILTQAKLKKKIWLNTWNEAQLWQLRGWLQPKSHAGLKHVQKNEMALGNETCIATQMNDGQRKQQHGTMASPPKSRLADLWEDFKKMWWRNQWLKPEDTEDTKGNEIKSNDTWIKVAKNQERWKAMESEYATTAAAVSVDSVQSRRNPPQDPVRHARYLNGVKLDEHEVANITEPHTEDQTDFDWYSGRHRLWTGTRNQTPKNWCPEGLMSSNHIDDRVCRTFPWDLCSLCQMNPWIQQPCSSFTVFPGTLAYPRVFEFNRICHSKGLLIFPRATLYSVLNRVPRVFLARWVRRTDISDSFCVWSWPQHSCPRGHWRMRSEDPLRRGGTLWKETNTNWARGSKRASETEKERNDKKRYSGFWRNSEASKVFHAQHLEGKERSSRRWKMTEARQSHPEKELRMSSVHFTASCMPKIGLEKKYKTLKTWK